MQFNWVEIKKVILNYCKKVFKENNIGYSESEINEAICIFKNFINKPCQYAFLNGLNKEIIPSLQNACVEKVGDTVSLKNLLTNVEVFLKKLLVLTNTVTYVSILDNHKNLMWLFKQSNISPNLTQNNPKIDESSYSSFIGNSDGLYLFCVTYIARNQVHNSNDWDASEVTFRLKYCLSLYIYIVLHYKEKLLSYDNKLNNEDYIDLFSDDESLLLYNYFSFGKTSITAKTVLVESFILYLLYRQGSLSIEDVEKEVKKFTQSSISSPALKRLIEGLNAKKSIEISNLKDISLTNKEIERIKEQEINFKENATIFDCSISDVLKKYAIEDLKTDIINHLRNFLEENYDIDINEGCEIIDTSSTQTKNYQNFFNYLKTNVKKEDSTIEELFKELMEVCKENDFLLRLSAGKVFSKVSDPDQFSNYVSNVDRQVYLDTQIILYALCINDNYSKYDNIYYKIACNLIEIASNRKDINLYLSNHYVGEITTHLKQALLLIPFTEIKEFEKYKISNNVFYSYYFQLKERNTLPNDIDSFADFMSDVFSLNEEDALDPSFYQIAYGILDDILSYLNIEIKDIPHYNEEEINNSAKIFQSAISTNMLELKKDKILDNDAIMGCHLFNKQYHDDKEPFFLTYDKAFTFYRKLFIDKYKRSKTERIHWYLFTPSKFLNHLDLISLRINTESLTDDFLSIIDNNKFKEKTKSIVDTISKLIDIKNISKEKRRDYIEMSKIIFTNEEFPHFVENVNIEGNTEIKRFAFLVDLLLNNYRDKGDDHIKNFKSMLEDKTYFMSVIHIIKKYCTEKDMTNENAIGSIDNLMNSFRQIVVEKLKDNK